MVRDEGKEAVRRYCVDEGAAERIACAGRSACYAFEKAVGQGEYKGDRQSAA